MSTASETTVTVTFDPTAINKQSDIIGAATPTSAGAMTAADKDKLDSLSPNDSTLADAYVQGGGNGGLDNTLGTLGTGMVPALTLRSAGAAVIDIANAASAVLGSLGLSSGVAALFGATGNEVSVVGGSAPGGSGLAGKNVNIHPGAGDGAGVPGLVDMLWSQLMLGGSGRSTLRSIVEAASVSTMELLAQGAASTATDPYLRVVKNRFGGFTDLIAMRLTNSANAAKNLLFNGANSSIVPDDVTWSIGGAAERFLAGFFGNDAVGTGQVSVVTLSNKTSATAGAQKYSPMVELEGQGWKTDAGGASQSVKWAMQTRPVQGAANPSSDLAIWNSVDGSAYAEKFRFRHIDVSEDTLFVGSGAELQLSDRPLTGDSRIITSRTILQLVSAAFVLSTADFAPTNDLTFKNGLAGNRWTETWSRLFMTVVGAVLDSTGVNVTIVPISGIHHVSGVGIIQNITPPIAGFVGSIELIPDAIWTTAGGGNIALASTAVVGKTMRMTYDGANWYPSY